MDDDPIQILEVRAPSEQRPPTLTAAVTASAADAIFVALSEQLDRHRRRPTATVEDLLALRERVELVERFAPLAASGLHAVVQINDHELRECLLDLSDYRERVDGDHFQPLALRRRPALVAEILAVLWDANATLAAAGARPLAPAPH